MRTTTKTVLGLAALAAGVATSMAQNVYSLNVVGYVNSVSQSITVGWVPNSFNLIINPLNNTSGGNNITNIFPGASMKDGVSIYRWNPAVDDLDTTIYTYFTSLNRWDNGCGCPSAGNGFVLNPGEAVFFFNAAPVNVSNTFVGDVLSAPYYLGSPLTTNTLVGGHFNAMGSTIPLGGNFTNTIAGIVPADGDSVYTWNATPAVTDLDPGIATYFTSLGRWDQGGVFPTNQIPVAVGCFYYRVGGTFTWGRNYTVQ